MTLLSVPIELGGKWGGSAPTDALAVITRMREVCLSGVTDRQPAKLRVEGHTSGPPHMWLHKENPEIHGSSWTRSVCAIDEWA
jgi:hypothetical protein